MRSNSLFRSIASMCLAAAAVACSVGHAVVASVHRCWDVITAWVSPPTCTQRKSPDQTRPVVALVTARSYVERLLRRVRPNVTTGWRMCPSA